MDSTAAPAPGWFPDPGDPSAERWWSGAGWTEHTRQPLGTEVPDAFAAQLATVVEAPAAPDHSARAYGAPEYVAPAAPPTPEYVAPAAPPMPAFSAPVPEYVTSEPAVTPPPPPGAPPIAAESGAQFVHPPAPGFPGAAYGPQEAYAPQETYAPQQAYAPQEVAAAAAFASADPSPAYAPQDYAPQQLAPAAFASAAPAAFAPAAFVPAPAAPAPASAAPVPAARPVGFTSSADPDVANRYRSVIHQAQVEVPAPSAPAAAAMGFGSMDFGSHTSASPTMTADRPMSADFMPSYATNKSADLALRTGLGATIGVLIGFGLRVVGVIDFAGSIMSVGAWVSGIVAIVAGIMGLVRARRIHGIGHGKALAGLLMGTFVSVLLPIGAVLLAVWLLGSLGMLV